MRTTITLDPDVTKAIQQLRRRRGIRRFVIEHGLTVCSADTDFARFEEVRWLDPLTR